MVNRLWGGQAENELYRSISLCHPSETTFFGCMRTLAQPSKGGLVRFLAVEWTEADDNTDQPLQTHLGWIPTLCAALRRTVALQILSFYVGSQVIQYYVKLIEAVLQ
jgi:hypothetical protein